MAHRSISSERVNTASTKRGPYSVQAFGERVVRVLGLFLLKHFNECLSHKAFSSSKLVFGSHDHRVSFNSS
jgi:hypothetical protein